MGAVVQPESISDTRKSLSKTVHRFRDEGPDADPVVFGSQRRAEAVLLPFEAYQALLEVAEDAAIARRVRERDASDTGNRTSLADAAAEFDVDIDEL